MANKCTSTGPLSISLSITDERGHTWTKDKDTITIIKGQAGDIYHLIAAGSGASLISTAIRIQGANFQSGAIDTVRIPNLASGTLEKLTNGQLIKIYAVAKGSNQIISTTVVKVYCGEAIMFGAYNDTLMQECDLNMNVYTPKGLLIWDTGNPEDKVTITPALRGLGSNLPSSGIDTIKINSTTIFTLTAQNSQWQSTTTCTVVITPPIKPLTVIVKERDNNGVPTNPVWNYQFTHSLKAPDASPYFTGNVNNFVPGKKCFTDDSIYIDPNKTRTSFLGSDVCNGDKGYAHIDWYPITYTGEIKWQEYSGCCNQSSFWESQGCSAGYTDNDYNFTMYRSDSALATSVDGVSNILLCEFDSKETVNRWKIDGAKTVWDTLRDYTEPLGWGSYTSSDDCEGLNKACNHLIGGRYAIVIGLFGLDCVHGCYAELHPVYAMFIHLNGDATSDRWAFFVRNWGNEGYCGTSQHIWQTNQIQVFIPKPGASNVQIHSNAYFLDYYYNNPDNVTTSPIPADGLFRTNLIQNQGVLLSFPTYYPSANQEITWEGELNFNWTTSNISYSKPLTEYPEYSKKVRPSGDKEEESERACVDTSIVNRINKLDANSKKEFLKRVNNLRTYDSSKVVRLDDKALNNSITISSKLPPIPKTHSTVKIVSNNERINKLYNQKLQILADIEMTKKTKQDLSNPKKK